MGFTRENKPDSIAQNAQAVKVAQLFNASRFTWRTSGTLYSMLTGKRGDAAARELAQWAKEISLALDKEISVDVRDDHPDSNTYLIRLAKGARVLLFRLSYAQAHTDGREAECERTLKRKITDLWNLI
jgi:hypothetical protein